MSQNQKTKRNPTYDIIIGGVYEHNESSREYLRVESFTAYDSEGKLLGTEDFPIYHAIVSYTVATYDPEGKTVFIERPNLRLAPDYIAERFHYTGVDLVK